jgi:UbiD family decarboxylase
MDQKVTRRGTNLDLDRFRLRNFIESLVGTDELTVVDSKIDYADVAAKMHGQGKAVWFKEAGAEGAELVGNVVGSRARIAKAFNTTPEGLIGELQRRLKNPVGELVEIDRSEAPCQEVVLTGDDIDVTKLPVHLQHSADGGPYISASVDYSVDPATGLTNSGFRRLLLRGKAETGVDLNAPTDLRQIYIATQAKGNKLPVAFVVGCHPIDMVSATMKVPGDELALVAALRDAPMGVVKCVTQDIRVPADAELVIEGYLDEKGYVEQEGPFGEYLGYYGVVKKNPVFHVTAITHRRDALFQTVTISGARLDWTDTSNLEALRMELNVWRALAGVVREVTGVYAPVSAGGSMSCRVSINPRYPGEARTALYAVLANVGVKNCFIVNSDIDITSDQQMEWALGTRFQGDRDLIVMTRMRSSPLDPSLNGGYEGTRCGYDLTWPLDQANRWELVIPTPPTYEGKKFPSVEAALKDGPKQFQELMAATGSRDGREIVLEIEKHRGKGLARDDQGRYFIQA